jgi:hypothetical protein
MARRISIRLDAGLAEWLEKAARERGVSQAQLVRDQLAKVRAAACTQGFMRLAGVDEGQTDLSNRKGFSRA